MTAVMWFRRDLRLRDNPALRAAAAGGDVLGLFVLDPVLWHSAGAARRGWLAASLRSLDESMGGRLCIRMGAPASVVPRVLADVGGTALHVGNDFTPYARTRDRAVASALPESVSGVATGTPYAVPPGSVMNGSGDPYKVYTPFSKAWRAHGWDDPAPAPRGVVWVDPSTVLRTGHDSDQRVAAMLHTAIDAAPSGMLMAGEDAAIRRFRAFVERDVDDYDTIRDDPGADRTSRMSPYLKLGVVHPRQLLAETAGKQSNGATTRTRRSWRGGSSTPTCCTTTRSRRGATCGRWAV